MFKIILIALLVVLFASGTSISQNLVPNSGFEEHLLDPVYGPSGVNVAPEWFTILGTPDFFHTEYRFPNSVPNNLRGFQEPASGNGYAGIISYTEAGTKELFGVELFEPLVAGKVYQLTFKVSLSGRSKFATDDIGAILIKGSRDSVNVKGITIRNTENNIIDDTTNWTIVSGRYLAEGGENILGIGNFAYGDGKIIRPDGDIWAYFYIDDIELREVCPNPTVDYHYVDKTACEGTTVDLYGEPQADSYDWIGGHTFFKLEAREEAQYIVNSYFNCSIIQTQYSLDLQPCDCALRVPTLISQITDLDLRLNLAENIQDFEFYLMDVWGRKVYSVSNQEEIKGGVPNVSAPYFWIAKLSCITSTEQTIQKTVSGKLIVQN